MKKNYLEVRKGLEAMGFCFKDVYLHTEGRYTPEDGIWNYKDALVHIPYIHPLVQNIPILNHKDSLVSLFNQKIFGLKFPMVVFDYEAEQHTQTAVFTLFTFALIVQNECKEVKPGITRITTHYNIGTSRWLAWALPLVGWVLKRNYKVLTSTDIPLRERRGQLREWGYDFPVSDYLNAEDIYKNNCQTQNAPCSLSKLEWIPDLHEGESKVFGRADHWGIRVMRRDQNLFIYPRMCPHEGAVLDQAPCQSNMSLSCPWHGRTLKPIAKIQLELSAPQIFQSLYHQFTFSSGTLVIEPKSFQAQDIPKDTTPLHSFVETPLST